MQGDYGRLDPYQVRNLAEEKSFAAPLREYRRRSQKWRKERNGTFESCTWYRGRSEAGP